MQYINSDALMFISVIVLLGWILWLHFRRRRQQMELKRIQLQLLTDALKRFGTAGEFVDFLQSKEGETMLYNGESPGKSRSRTKIFIVQAGTLLTFAGIVLLICASRYSGTPGPDSQDLLDILIFSGTVAISMGVGLYAVAAVTFLWERWVGDSVSDQKLAKM